MKIKQTPQQRANTIEALEVMFPSIPPENIYKDFNWWRKGRRSSASKPPTCRTVACIGGWCAWWPSFIEQGVYCDMDGAPKGIIKLPNSAFFPVGSNEVAKILFGHLYFFDPRGDLEPDFDFKGTDHELIAHRLKWLLENSEVVE